MDEEPRLDAKANEALYGEKQNATIPTAPGISNDSETLREEVMRLRAENERLRDIIENVRSLSHNLAVAVSRANR